MNNLETNETRARYKEQESRIMMRNELSDEQKDVAIDALFDRYCADNNCYGSNTRTQTRLSSSSGNDTVNSSLGVYTIIVMIIVGIIIGKNFDLFINIVQHAFKMFLNTPK